ncbi:MAG: HEAT repeat domain-containing protein, partial [Candidatus Methylomirabilales bacterium]
MSKFDELLDKSVEYQSLSAEELDMVKDELVDPESPEDRATLLHILGHAGGPEMVPVVEPFLDSPEDPFLARMALQVLCNSWGLAEKYHDRISEFIRGVPWDDEDDVVRDMAISCAGISLREHWDPELAGMLIGIAQDESEEELTRNWAMFSLGRA